MEEPIAPYTCPHCGEAFEEKGDLMKHLVNDNCKIQVQQEIELYESRNGKAHQADLEDFTGWGE